MQNAQTVLDNVNKYRYGVLIGNSTEERFGEDAAQRSRNEKFPISTQKDHYSVANSTLNTKNTLKPEGEKEFNNHVKFSNRGVQNHILVGHGVRDEDFQKKYRGTNYDLSYNQQIHTKTQVWSKFDANPETTQRPFHKDTLYEKEYQKSIPELGTKVERTQKPFKPYAEFTKTYDATHYKIPLRK